MVALSAPARSVLFLALGTGATRLLLAWGTGLGIDESYMVAAGRVMRLSYFDHPGMAWWLSRGAAVLFGSEAPIVVRLPFVALFAVSTGLMFLLTRRLFGPRAGMWAAVALNLSPVFSVTTGTWVLPDGPLICALLAGVYALVRALEARSWIWWSVTGFAAGLALLSKYSAALVLIGILPYLLTQPTHRVWLRRPQPYVAAAIALACCAPILIWNARHGWASLAFQGGRAASASLHPFAPLATLAGEALFVGPWIWLPMICLWLAALRHGPSRPKRWLLAWLAATPILLFVVVSLWARHVLFHWAAPGYLMLFPILGAWVERIEASHARWVRVGSRAAAGLIVTGCVLLLIEARVNLLAPFGIDPGLQAIDWTGLRDQVAARGLLPPGRVVAGTNWHDTGKLDYGFGGSVPVLCLNPDSREYLFASDPEAARGHDVLLIGQGLTAERLARTYAGSFDAIEPLPPLTLRGTDIPIFLGRDWRGG